MKVYWLSFLLVIAVALQSFTTAAEFKETHQVSSQHLQVEHSHESDHNITTNDTESDPHKIDDCHHCGHCQGSHAQWISSKKSSEIAIEFIVLNDYFYLNAIDSMFSEQLIRPPIS